MKPTENFKYPSADEETASFRELLDGLDADQLGVLGILQMSNPNGEEIEYLYEVMNPESDTEVHSRERLAQILDKLASPQIGVISVSDGYIYRNTAFFTFLDTIRKPADIEKMSKQALESTRFVFPWLNERFSARQQHVLAAVMLLFPNSLEKQAILDYIDNADEIAPQSTPLAMNMAELDIVLAELAEQGLISIDGETVQRVNTQFFDELQQDALEHFGSK